MKINDSLASSGVQHSAHVQLTVHFSINTAEKAILSTRDLVNGQDY